MKVEEVTYSCPMHPEITSDKPGSCPKCGMALVEKDASKNSVQDKFHSHPGHHEGMDPMEHHRMMAEDFRRRFFVVLPLTLVVLILSPQIQEWFNFTLEFPFINIVLFALGTVIAVYGGLPFYQASKDELKTRNYGMMTLVSLAVRSGYLFSVAATFAFPGESLWWEISTLVLAFLFGHWMEMRAVIGTGGALKELAKLIPPNAHKITGNEVQDVATESLRKGDLVLVKPGEKIPADGIVVRGESSVNEAMITGESRPVAKKEGSEVIGGTINSDGSLTVKVTKTGSESAISQITDLIRQAQNTKPLVQNLADKAANVLTIIAIVVGGGTFVYWFFINPQGAVFAATLAITVVVITCPHALGLAIPTVTTITTSLAAKNGILIRDMKGLEIAKKLDYVVFDKTGTLTKGEFGVTRIILNKGADEKEFIALAAAVESHSEHSLAKGIVNEAKKKNVVIPEAAAFKAIKGKGAQASVGGDLVIVGNKKLMDELSVSTDLSDKTDDLGTYVYVAKNKKILGVLVLSDEIREESKRAIKDLHARGIKVAMLTGDKNDVAQDVGKELGIDTIFAEVLPEDKVNKIKELQKTSVVAMVGDGVNDAPSLTQAHVGIAIGAGTSVAIESAEIVLVQNNPMDVVKIINLSRATDAKMKQNLAWATGYNLLAIPTAAGIFYPWGITLRPEWGALAMSASSLIVVANALLLRKVRL